jgi:hypothetical protein
MGKTQVSNMRDEYETSTCCQLSDDQLGSAEGAMPPRDAWIESPGNPHSLAHLPMRMFALKTKTGENIFRLFLGNLG